MKINESDIKRLEQSAGRLFASCYGEQHQVCKVSKFQGHYQNMKGEIS